MDLPTPAGFKFTDCSWIKENYGGRRYGKNLVVWMYDKSVRFLFNLIVKINFFMVEKFSPFS